jgi:hypothetical protein
MRALMARGALMIRKTTAVDERICGFFHHRRGVSGATFSRASS